MHTNYILLCYNIRTVSMFILLVVAADYSLMPQAATTITLSAGVIPTYNCVTVLATDDAVVEADEDFTIVITTTDLTDVTVGTDDTTTVTIPSNDGMVKKAQFMAS